MIWTNVARTNVARTNITVTVFFCKDGPMNLLLKFGKNRVSNSWDIPDMDKCHQDKCCVEKCHCDSYNLSKMVPGTFFQSLVKIGFILAEIFLIWTNVAGTNVARTNVIVTLESVKKGPRNLTFKFGQNRVSNNWDISNIEFLWGWWVVVGQCHFCVTRTQVELGFW